MRLEFLDDGSPDCPLIRLYDFELAEVRQLRDLVRAISTGARDRVAVHEEPASKRSAAAGCSSHEASSTDGPTGFQWLSAHGDISLLISRDGAW